MTEPTALTFEAGYTRLQTISQRVTSEEVPVAEMCDLFAEGKGLQKALTEYLDDQKSRVEAIERGQGIQAFRVVAPAAEAGPAPIIPADADDLASAPPARPAPVDDDIPF
jgi:exodeoxyribonuclease VII small subunit